MIQMLNMFCISPMVNPMHIRFWTRSGSIKNLPFCKVAVQQALQTLHFAFLDIIVLSFQFSSIFKRLMIMKQLTSQAHKWGTMINLSEKYYVTNLLMVVNSYNVLRLFFKKRNYCNRDIVLVVRHLLCEQWSQIRSNLQQPVGWCMGVLLGN